MIKKVNVVSDINELSITDFERLVYIFNKTYESKIEQYVDIIEVISSLNKDEIENMDINEFKKLIEISEKIKTQDLTKTKRNKLIVDGITYKTNYTNGEYKFTVKEITLIQKAIANNPNQYLAEFIAIVFKNVDENGNTINDLSSEAIANRKEKLKNIKMKLIGPYFNSLTKFLFKETEVENVK